MPLENVIAGRYTTTYDSNDVGVLEDGVEYQQESRAQVVNRTDAYGDTVIDTLYRGGDVHFQFVCQVYAANAIAPFWPWATLGILATAANPIGRRGSDEAKALVLTDVDNTPAATSPATLTAADTILAENYPARIRFDSSLRQVPIRLRCFPYDNTGTITWFVTT